MKYITIILFFIFIIIISMRIQMDIQRLEIINQKIKFKIKVKIYIFKRIKVFSKRITKKDIIKLVNFSAKKKDFKKEKKIIKRIYNELSEIEFNIDYGMKNISLNTYLYIILNTAIPMIINKYSTRKTIIKYNIKNNYKRNFFHLEYKSKINIDILKSIFKIWNGKKLYFM